MKSRKSSGSTGPDSVRLAHSMLTVEEVEDALTNVIDPELGLDFVELGLIYGIEVDDGRVHVTFTLTTPGVPDRPAGHRADRGVRRRARRRQERRLEMIFTPPWTPDRMSEDAKFALGY